MAKGDSLPINPGARPPARDAVFRAASILPLSSPQPRVWEEAGWTTTPIPRVMGDLQGSRSGVTISQTSLYGFTISQSPTHSWRSIQLSALYLLGFVAATRMTEYRGEQWTI